MENTTTIWYVVKEKNETCNLVSIERNFSPPTEARIWGPFDTQQEAIAKRVGLIRAGKCKPQ